MKVPPPDEAKAKVAPDTGAEALLTVVVKVEISPDRKIDSLGEIDTCS